MLHLRSTTPPHGPGRQGLHARLARLGGVGGERWGCSQDRGCRTTGGDGSTCEAPSVDGCSQCQGLTWAGSPQWNGVPTRKGSPPGNMNLDAHQRGSLGVLLSELRTHLSLLSTSACTEVVRRRAPRPGGPWHRREGPVCEPSRSDGRRPPRDVTLPAGRVPRGPAQRRNEAAAG